MTEPGVPARDLFIIARDYPELYDYVLCHRPDVDVILDRRTGDRRHRTEPYEPERRGARNRRTRSAINDDLEAMGVGIVSFSRGWRPLARPTTL